MSRFAPDVLSESQHRARFRPVLRLVEEIMQTHDLRLESVEKLYKKWIDQTEDPAPPCYTCNKIKECAETGKECQDFYIYCKDRTAVKDKWFQRTS